MVNNKKDKYNFYTSTNRKYSEFWIICLIVGLGFVESFYIGFYRFRFVDLIFILSIFYLIRMVVNRTLGKKEKTIILVAVMFIATRIIFDLGLTFDRLSLKTLLGMSATFLTPVIFFVVRNSKFNESMAVKLLAIAAIISLFSQMGLLGWGESTRFGSVDLSFIFGGQFSTDNSFEIQERTITVWRALSVGLTFAIILARTKIWVKVLGIVGMFLQFGGGGGGRGGLVFIFMVPIVIFFLSGYKIQKVRKVVLGMVFSLGFAIIYLWAPFGEKLLEKTNYKITHYERATEIFYLFTGGWEEATLHGGFNARTIGYMEYINRIFTEWDIFFWGVGFQHGAAFDYTVNEQAHNVLLDTWALSGLFGILILIAVQLYVFSDLRILIKTKTKNVKYNILIIAYSVAILFFYQALLFQAVSSDRSFMIVFYLTAGLLLPLHRYIVQNENISEVRIL